MSDRLAIDGGSPVRVETLPYGRQSISPADVEAVASVLGSGWLTTGPEVERFEAGLASACGVGHAVAVSNGTAALQAMYHGAGIAPGDEVVVPSLTFAATANAALMCQATPVFAEVDDTMTLDPASVAAAITPRTKAVVSVDFAGQPADHEALRALCADAGVRYLSDGAHSIGADYRGRPSASWADASTLSFHPVKTITTGEGGAIVTDDDEIADRARRFRNHGITRDFRERVTAGTWEYDIAELGYNLRLSDLQCALGSAQLLRFQAFKARRAAIVAAYDEAFAHEPVRRVARVAGGDPCWHIYVLRLDPSRLTATRDRIFAALQAEGIGVNVHYKPVHEMSLYRRLAPGTSLPFTERLAGEILTLPLFPDMSDADVGDVVTAVRKVLAAYRG
jgi:perosamine synthetase